MFAKSAFPLIALTATMAFASSQSDLQKQAKISMDDAQATALKAVPGEIKSKELEKEHGRLIYSFDIKTAKKIHEVNVDANTGKIVENSVETAADERKEAAADKSPK